MWSFFVPVAAEASTGARRPLAFMIVVLLVAAGCGTSPQAIDATVTSRVATTIASISTATPQPTVTPHPTATPQPTPSPAPPPTAQPTPTPAPTPTPHALPNYNSIDFEHRLGRSLNEFFDGFIRTPDKRFERADLDAIWTSGGLKVPQGYEAVDFVSRRTFRYPHLAVQFNKLPVFNKLPPPDDKSAFQVGFGTQETPWMAWFRVSQYGASFWAGGKVDYGEADINALMPLDYTKAWHFYEIKVNRQNVELYIDGELKGVILLGVQEPITKPRPSPPIEREWNMYPPYILDSAKEGLPAELPLFVQLRDMFGGRTVDFNPGKDNMLVAYDGDPSPPRMYPLYNENTSTKWNGLSTSAMVTSHPVPVWGYDRNTLLFQSSAPGKLAIQVFAGRSWRTVEAPSLAANVLATYSLGVEAPIARAQYIPVGTDTIAVAEWHLAG